MPTTPPNDVKQNIQLARQAAEGDAKARQCINEWLHPIITYQSERFCKRFCAENKFLYRCTLEKKWGNPPANALHCEWGNASYAWMLDDLANENRLRSYEGRQGARLNDFFYFIANSLPFYERWKDWRFGRRVNVPNYITDISPEAGKVFLALRSQHGIEHIAQNLAISEQHCSDIAQRIVTVLSKRKRLYLLDPPKNISLSNSGDDEDHATQSDVSFEDLRFEDLDTLDHLKNGWEQLSAVEQFVIEAMQIEERDANDVLESLAKLNIALDKKTPAHKTSRQQLYYFRRKTLIKLGKLSQLLD